MAVYFVTGKLGSGKTLVAVKRMQEYMQRGARIATNLDIDIDMMMPGSKDKTRHVLRIPDKPTAHDMEMIGRGYEGEDYDETRFGICVLDELGTWLNSRSWSDPDRKKFLDWTIHARKLRWDIIFIVQNVQMVDAQLRDALCEHLVVCRRADRIKIMGIRLPKVHVGAVFYGATENKAMKLERWIYRGKDLYGAYDTAQAFSPFYDKGGYCPLLENYFEPEVVEQQVDTKKQGILEYAKYAIAAAFGAASVVLASTQSVKIGEETLSETSAVESVEKEASAQKVDWLAGMRPVYYQGNYKHGDKENHMFRSMSSGEFGGDYLQKVGATVTQVSVCIVIIGWPDQQTDIVHCNPDSVDI